MTTAPSMPPVEPAAPLSNAAMALPELVVLRMVDSVRFMREAVKAGFAGPVEPSLVDIAAATASATDIPNSPSSSFLLLSVLDVGSERKPGRRLLLDPVVLVALPAVRDLVVEPELVLLWVLGYTRVASWDSFSVARVAGERMSGARLPRNLSQCGQVGTINTRVLTNEHVKGSKMDASDFNYATLSCMNDHRLMLAVYTCTGIKAS